MRQATARRAPVIWHFEGIPRNIPKQHSPSQTGLSLFLFLLHWILELSAFTGFYGHTIIVCVWDFWGGMGVLIVF